MSVGAVTQEIDSATGGRPAIRYSVLERLERLDNPPPFRVNRVNRVPPPTENEVPETAHDGDWCGGASGVNGATSATDGDQEEGVL
jgi:hypothetical protein